MTSTDTQGTTCSTDTTPPRSKTRKSVLFCPDCGFESPIDENWIIRWDEATRTYVCPDCDNAVVSR